MVPAEHLQPALPEHPAQHALPPHKKGSGKRAHVWFFIVGIGVLVLAILGTLLLTVLHRRREHREAAALTARIDKGPTVQVAKVKAGDPKRTVTLPGDARAFLASSLYGKISGYVKAILVDKGDRVLKDQLLAVLESPETDTGVSAAEADLVLKQEMSTRADTLAKSGVVAEQDRENAEANLKTSRANLTRAQVLKHYEMVRAPFSGTITARYVDPGALVPAATGSTTGATPVVDLADTDTLRVTLYLGQDLTPFVKLHDQVEVWQDAAPQKKIIGTISRLAGALDPRTRTMLTEVWFDNREAQIYPGTYVHVAVTVAAPPIPTVPAEAVFFREGKTLVALMEGEDKIKFAEVTEESNEGKTIRLNAGVKEGDRVVVNLPSDLDDGSAVQVAKDKAADGGADPSAQGGAQGGQQGSGPPSESSDSKSLPAPK